MNMAVLGAGAMGCLFGGRLAEAGHRVIQIDVRRELIDAIDRPYLIGVIKDSTGSFRIALGVLAILPLAAMILTLQVRRLQPAPAGRQNARRRPTAPPHAHDARPPCPPPVQPSSKR